MNHHPDVVLFDSRSSHSFMSYAFAHRYKLLEELGYKYRISLTGVDVLADHLINGATLAIAGRCFR